MTAIAQTAANSNPPPLANYQAEQALLGAILANNEVWHTVSDYLLPVHFADALHGRIFDACGKLLAQGSSVNPITLKRVFDQDLALAEIGGAKYLVDLASAVISVRHADDFARIIVDLFQRRELLSLGVEMQEEAQIADPEKTAGHIIEFIEGRLTSITATNQHDDRVQTSGAAAYQALQAIEHARRVGYGGLSTGFRALDRRMGGLHNSDLIVLAGRPSMGKTDLALNIADNVAVAAWHARQMDPQCGAGAVYFASMEMGAEQIAMRQLARRTQLTAHQMRGGYVSDEQFARIVDAQQEMDRIPLVIDDEPAMSPAKILSHARRTARKFGGLDLIVVDYLQLMTADGNAYKDNKVQQISAISAGMKRIAKQLKVPVIALSQLNRAVEARDDKRPNLADLRDSGSIEQDADSVIFIYRDEYYLKRAEPKRRATEKDSDFIDRISHWERECTAAANIAEAIIAKQRHGPIGTARLHFNGAHSTFGNLQEEAGD